MTNVKKDANQKRLELRNEFWPDCEKEIYDGPKIRFGYAQMPRIIPFVSSFINKLHSVNAGALYVVLWAHNFGQGFIDADPDTFMFEAGYQHRVARGWKERIGLLEQFGFIRTRKSGNKEYAYVLLLDPYVIMMDYFSQNKKLPNGCDLDLSDWQDVFRRLCHSWGTDPDGRHKEVLEWRQFKDMEKKAAADLEVSFDQISS